MRRFALSCFVTLAACGAEPPPEEPVANPTVADFAGAWDLVITFPENFDTVRAVLSGSAAANDWVMLNPGDQRVAMSTVSLKGDSLILVSDKFTAVVVPNATAQVRTATVRVGDVLQGILIATFDMADGSQQVRTANIRATVRTTP
jgi:hypothetical protein